MTNTPLSASEQSKVLIFTLLMVPAILAGGAGVLPALLLAFGLFMMKKQQDFSHLETAVRNVTYLLYLACAISTFFALWFIAEYLSAQYEYDRNNAAFSLSFILLILGISLAYVAAVKFLLLKPLQAHSDWVASNGIFSSKAKVVSSPAAPNLDIIQGEKLRSYSVADELLKWAKLKEDGHISEEEYNEARKKLLKRA